MNDLDTIEIACLEHIRILFDEKMRILSDSGLLNLQCKQLQMVDAAISDACKELIKVREIRFESDKRLTLLSDYKRAKAKGVV